jgi:hypothetical protein
MPSGVPPVSIENVRLKACLEPFVPLPLVLRRVEKATDAALTTLAKSVVNVEAEAQL